MNSLEKKAVSPVESGYTNKVWRTNEGTVVKKYRNFSVGSIIYFILNLVFFRQFVTAKKRIEAEKKVREVMSEEYNFPKIINEEYPWLEMEEVKAQSMAEIINQGEIDAKKAGKQFGKMVKAFHSEECYRNDWNLEDVFLQDDKPVMVDLEFGGAHATELRKKVDRVFLLYQSRLMDSRDFQKFYRGLSTHVDVSRFEVFLGFFAAFFTAMIYFWDDGKPYFVLKNWYRWKISYD